MRALIFLLMVSCVYSFCYADMQPTPTNPIKVVYVQPQSGPYETIQEAVGVCSGGEIIVVTPNTSPQGYNNIHVVIDDSTLKDNGDPNTDNWNGRPITIRSYRGNPESLELKGGYGNPVFLIDDIDVVIDGFTIKNGYGKNLTGTHGGDAIAGGGICANPYSSIIIEDCHITNNSCTCAGDFYAYGGGIYIGPIGSAVPAEGYDVIIKDCTIKTNQVEHSPYDMITQSKGAGVYCKGLGNATIQFNLIQDNHSEDEGGSLYMENNCLSIDPCEIKIEGNEFAYNRLSNNVAGVGLAFVAKDFTPSSSTLIFVNNLIYKSGKNVGDSNEGAQRNALLIKDIANAYLINNTVTQNRFDSPTGESGVLKVIANSGPRILEAYNNIFYDNYDPSRPQIRLKALNFWELTATLNCNCIQNGTASVVEEGEVVLENTGIVFDPPCFLNPTENDFHLTPSSNVIGDIGISQGLIYLPPIDYYGGPRIVDGWGAFEIDFGSDEYDG